MAGLDEQGLKLVSIGDILHEAFVVPYYQRGYRWNERQVTDLLNDIFEFVKKENKEAGEFYCLQPIVVAKKGSKWRIIDGQQRLTTIYIILKFLEDVKSILFPQSKFFSLSYETREKSEEFLKEIRKITEKNIDNADFYCMSVAYLTIKKWFEKKKETDCEQFLNALIGVNHETEGNAKIDNANNVRFIWYNVSSKTQDVENTENELVEKKIFTKINMGKIPLTNAELIKALFLTSNIEEKEKWQNNFSYEWNEIEDTLQSDDFYFFLNNEQDEKATRIDFIFDLFAETEPLRHNPYRKKDNYYTFEIFNHLIRIEKKSVSVLWKEVKNIFKKLQEWFSDNECYHLVGYLTHTKKSIMKIYSLSNNLKKSDFKKKLKGKIKKTLSIKENKLLELTYYENSGKIKDILLLFNIISTMNARNIRFPFKKYINEKWSLEHIHARNSKKLKIDDERRALLEEQKDYYTEIKKEIFTTKIEELLKQEEIDIDEFEDLQKKLDEEKDIHLIYNLALLSSIDNSSLSNDVFKEKRRKIISLDVSGAFIPICTKNVFLKYYNRESVQNEKWMQKDRDEYLSAIKNTLKEYL